MSFTRQVAPEFFRGAHAPSQCPILSFDHLGQLPNIRFFQPCIRPGFASSLISAVRPYVGSSSLRARSEGSATCPSFERIDESGMVPPLMG